MLNNRDSQCQHIWILKPNLDALGRMIYFCAKCPSTWIRTDTKDVPPSIVPEQKKEPIPSDFMKQFNSIRLLILMESAPLSNKYRQVLLDWDQFKAISDKIASLFPGNCNCPNKCVNLKVGDDDIKLPDLDGIHECTDGCCDDIEDINHD